jgi:FixJ family two-component response regulator
MVASFMIADHDGVSRKPAPPRRHTARHSMSAMEGCFIVLVDDDASVSHALARVLRLSGYEPIIFPSAEALLAVGSVVPAACLVLDVHLPGVTGFELYEKIARTETPPPVIFITAYDEPEARAQAASAGAAAYFTKPFSGRDLVAAIKRAINVRATDAPAA